MVNLFGTDAALQVAPPSWLVSIPDSAGGPWSESAAAPTPAQVEPVQVMEPTAVPPVLAAAHDLPPFSVT
jgi:hypothetical protein